MYRTLPLFSAYRVFHVDDCAYERGMATILRISLKNASHRARNGDYKARLDHAIIIANAIIN